MRACLLYLQLYVGESVSTKELEIVSGIPTYARRLRQLRVECGYDIISKASSEGWSYTLRTAEPNPRVADLWRKLNSIRRMDGSGESRILEAFKSFVGQPLDIEALTYVSKIKSSRERVRDLRLHKGWRIFGRHTGRPDLAVTEYVLESLAQLPPHDRNIPDAVYESVLERDGYCCKKANCRWSLEQRKQGSRRQSWRSTTGNYIRRAEHMTSTISSLCAICITTKFIEYVLAGSTLMRGSSRQRGQVVLTKSEQMARVRARDTLPELLVRRLLSDEGVRYRLHRKDIPGCPDLYIPRLHLAVFVNGCFWHGHHCSRGVRPKTNPEFWNRKLERNVKRDAEVRTELSEIGVDAVTLWTCETERFSHRCHRIASRYYRQNR